MGPDRTVGREELVYGLGLGRRTQEILGDSVTTYNFGASCRKGALSLILFFIGRKRGYWLKLCKCLHAIPGVNIRTGRTGYFLASQIRPILERHSSLTQLVCPAGCLYSWLGVVQPPL